MPWGRHRRVVHITLACLVLCGAVAIPALPNRTHRSAPTSSYRVIHEFPHDPAAFTQGLIYLNGVLYESTGLRGHSSLRRVELNTGRVLQESKVPDQYFAEGLTEWSHHLIQLTWISHVGFIYDLASFSKLGEFRYPGEGWGLTHDAANLILSDGTASLRFLDPATFQAVRTLQVTDNGEPVTMLNELEYVRGDIYANVWQTDKIACISPQTGLVKRWIDLSGLLGDADRNGPVDVLNGIAYDSKNDVFLITGKLWPKLFAVKFTQ